MILAVRDAKVWVKSVNRYYNLGEDLKTKCRSPGYFSKWPKDQNMTDHDLEGLYMWQVDYVRQFATEHPSLTYIEIKLEDGDDKNGAILEEAVGIPADCWGHSNVNKGQFEVRKPTN